MSACDIYRYRGLGVEGHHDSCTDNLFKGVLRETGVHLAMQVFNHASMLRHSSLHLCPMQCLPASKQIGDLVIARAHVAAAVSDSLQSCSAGRQEAVVLITD